MRIYFQRINVGPMPLRTDENSLIEFDSSIPPELSVRDTDDQSRIISPDSYGLIKQRANIFNVMKNPDNNDAVEDVFLEG
jgi:hypothetical protein